MKQNKAEKCYNNARYLSSGFALISFALFCSQKGGLGIEVNLNKIGNEYSFTKTISVLIQP